MLMNSFLDIKLSFFIDDLNFNSVTKVVFARFLRNGECDGEDQAIAQRYNGV